jgi:hypothetical protein
METEMSRLKKFNEAFDRSMCRLIDSGVEGFDTTLCGIRWPFTTLGNIGMCVFLLACAMPVVLVMAPFAIINWLTGDAK